MRDILSEIDRWREDHDAIALATVIQTWGSSPRRVGSKMALTRDGKITGSVSGGCVENAVVEAGIESLETNRARLLHFGVADETAWEVGLACGGSIDIFVKPLDLGFFPSLRSVLMNEEVAVLNTVVRGPDGSLGREMLITENGHLTGSIGKEWDQRLTDLAGEILSQGISRRIKLNENTEVFAELVSPAPTLVVVGGVHIAIALVSLAKTLGYRTVVIDPRKVWGNVERFPHVDQLIQAWPAEAFQQLRLTRSTAMVMLTHDPKLDDPALRIALTSPAFYVGALGSRGTQAKRQGRLLDAGLTETHLARLHAPIGLNIATETPEEIALAIMAQVVDDRRRQARAAESLMHGEKH